MESEVGGQSNNFEGNIGRGNRRAPRRGNGRTSRFSRGRTFYHRPRPEENYQVEGIDEPTNSSNGQSANRSEYRPERNFNKQQFRSKNENWRRNFGGRNFPQFRRGKNSQMSVHAKEFVPQNASSNNDFQAERSSSDFSNLPQDNVKHDEQSSESASSSRRNNPVPEQKTIRSNRSEKSEDQAGKRENFRFSNYNQYGGNRGFRKNNNSVDSYSSSRSNNLNTKRSKEFSSFNVIGKEDEATHRDRLIDQLVHNNCECSVCCDRVRPQDSVWSCTNCYTIFHLKCIRKWARSPAALVEGAGWRCPLCQQVTEVTPSQYYCFCGKIRDPIWNRYDTPHSCGQQCGRQRTQKNCVHRCNILCHPGPCPSCQAQVQRTCECGKTKRMMRCGLSEVVLCSETCSKLLNCGVHKCQKICHPGSCDNCDEKIVQNCYCGKEEKYVVCTKETAGKEFFACGAVCNRQLLCKQHFCTEICHPGDCGPCCLLPEFVTHCPCGKSLLTDISKVKRTSCTDPIPSCQQLCQKQLPCGSEDNHHKCNSICHTGECPKCPLKSQIKCRCGSQTKEIECDKMLSEHEFTCEKKCMKKRQCGRHKCLQKCCVDQVHICELLCNRKLSCGRHVCEDLCHRGNCPPCWHTGFDELSCHCGASVLYPPIACGTKPPECNRPCARTHPCDHTVTHSCHADDKCPPCTFLTEKLCYGEHELRSNVPCYLTDVSCGRPCNKLLPCGQHKCPLTCHPGQCLKPGVNCSLPCTKLRTICSHPCYLPCHGDSACPESLCRAKVTITCQCGHLSKEITCGENQRALQQLAASAMASKLYYLQPGQTVDISDSVKTNGPNKNKRLECNDDCALIDRNRRLALALQIRNPELTNKLGPPTYTDFLKDQMKQNARFVTHVYNKLTELVQNAKQSKQKSRSFAFPPMNRDQRRVIHELAEYFGCDTQSYDEEPKKNVVVTALRDKSWLPSVSVMTVIERESVHRKAPPPIPHNKSVAGNTKSESTNEVQTATSNSSLTNLSTEAKPPIDYFDYTPDA